MKSSASPTDTAAGVPAPEPAIAGNIVTLRQLREQLGNLSPEHYRWCPDAAISSIGAHVRHIIDHYYCFVRDLAGGVIDYDSRPRSRALETELHSAVKALGHYERVLDDPQVFAVESPLVISGHVLPDRVPQRANTSIGRELLFLQSHTLHHMAIIGLLLHQQEVVTPESFGASAATLRSPASSLDIIE